MITSEEPGLCFIHDIEQFGMGDWRESQSTANTEQEDVWDWLKGIGSGAAQGAATGAAAGPWGAVIGGLAGAGLGAVQTATQQAAQQQGQGGPAASQPPPDQSTNRPPAAPVLPSTAPSSSSAGQGPAGKVPGISPDLIQQLTQLLPLIGQLLAQQSRASPTGSTNAEGEDGQYNGDYVSDDAFMAGENAHQASNDESSETGEVAESEMAQEQESLLDWVVEAGSSPHAAEWTQEGSIEVTPAWSGL